MSFVRMSGRSRQGPSKTGGGAQLGEKRRRVRRKPQWDETVNDLTVHKASPDELERRKAVAKSKNLDVVKAEKFGRKVAKARAQQWSPGRARQKRQNALLREILFDQPKFQETLNKSDRVLAVVKDLFGDDAQRKYKGLPNVTVAPNMPNKASKLPDGSFMEHPSMLDKLSEAVMDRGALNDVDDGSQYTTDSSEGEEDGLSYQPQMDLSRFQRLLANAERDREEASRTAGQHLSHSMAERALEEVLSELQHKHNKMVQQASASPLEGSYLDDTLTTTPQVTAMNDTGKVKRTMARTDQGQSQGHTEDLGQGEGQQPLPSNLEDLRKVLDGLETNIRQFEAGTGRQPLAQGTAVHTYSGYTQALVDSVSRLTGYLRESEQRLKIEMALREQLSQDVSQLKGLVDALTGDIISTQEEYATLQNEFVRYRRDNDQQMAALRQTLSAVGIEVPVVRPQPTYPQRPAPGSYTTDQRPHQGSYTTDQRPHQGSYTTDQPPPPPERHLVNGTHITNGLVYPSTSGSDDVRSIDSAAVDELAMNMDQALRTHIQRSQLQEEEPTQSQPRPPSQGAGSGLPRPRLPGQWEAESGQGPAYLLSPPKQTDSPRADAPRSVAGHGLEDLRQRMRFDPPQNVQNIIREQQELAAKQQLQRQQQQLQRQQQEMQRQQLLQQQQQQLQQQLTQSNGISQQSSSTHQPSGPALPATGSAHRPQPSSYEPQQHIQRHTNPNQQTHSIHGPITATNPQQGQRSVSQSQQLIGQPPGQMGGAEAGGSAFSRYGGGAQTVMGSTDRMVLQQQLEELNRQHEEAQRKLEQIQLTQQAKRHGPASPSISPIPQASDTASEVSVVRPQAGQSRQVPAGIYGGMGGGTRGAFARLPRAPQGGFGPPREITVSIPRMPPADSPSPDRMSQKHR